MIKRMLFFLLIVQEMSCVNKFELFTQGVAVCAVFGCAMYCANGIKKQRARIEEQKKSNKSEKSSLLLDNTKDSYAIPIFLSCGGICLTVAFLYNLKKLK